MQAKIQINNIQYQCLDIALIDSTENNHKYQLMGIDPRLLKFAQESFTMKQYFDVLITVDDSMVIDGEAAIFNHIEPLSKNAQLTINFVN